MSNERAGKGPSVGKGLGMGLQALLGEAGRAPETEAQRESRGGVREIEISSIRPNPDQPRTQFDEAALEDLAASIRERGVLQPILLRPDGDGFMIVAGERRWRAAQRAPLHAIPAIVRNIDDSTTAELALIENIQREDLNPLEEAEGYRALIDKHNHTQDDVAQLVHKSRSHIANLLRLLDLPSFVRESLLRGDISMGHARAVATAPDAEQLTRLIIRSGMSVRQAEDEARRQKHKLAGSPEPRGSGGRSGDDAANADIQALERQLGDILGLRVQVTNKGSAGTVSLHYSTLDQLDMICQRLSGEPI